jgi:hypothetical protein
MRECLYGSITESLAAAARVGTNATAQMPTGRGEVNPHGQGVDGQMGSAEDRVKIRGQRLHDRFRVGRRESGTR